MRHVRFFSVSEVSVSLYIRILLISDYYTLTSLTGGDASIFEAAEPSRKRCTVLQSNAAIEGGATATAATPDSQSLTATMSPSPATQPHTHSSPIVPSAEPPSLSVAAAEPDMKRTKTETSDGTVSQVGVKQLDNTVTGVLRTKPGRVRRVPI